MTRRGISMTLNKEQIEQAITAHVAGLIAQNGLPKPIGGRLLVMDDLPDQIGVEWFSEEDDQ